MCRHSARHTPEVGRPICVEVIPNLRYEALLRDAVRSIGLFWHVADL